MAGCATSQSCACTTSGRHGRGRCRDFFKRQPGADHRVPHRQCPGHHVVAEGEFVRILRGRDHPHTLADLVGRRVRAGVGAGGTPGQHHDIVTGRGQRGRQVMHVPAKPADHHRRVLPRHHQDLHGRPLSRACATARRRAPGSLRASRRRTDRRRDSSRRPAAGRCRGGPMPARRRSRGWRGHAGGPGSGRSRRPSLCSP